ISLVNWALLLSRRSISSEISTAESSCTKRSSSILASRSAMDCSKSRKLVFMDCSFSKLGAFYPKGQTQAFSVLDRYRIKAAPEIPGSDRTPRPPAFADLDQYPARLLFAGKIAHEDGALQADIVQRINIRSHQVEDQEHFCRPAADTTHGNQFGNDFGVAQLRPGCRLQLAAQEMPGQVAQILHLAPRKTAAVEPLGAEC